MVSRLRVFIAASESAVRKKISGIIIKAGYQVVAEAEDGPGALRLIRTVAADMVILDFDLTGINGIEVAKIIEEEKIAPIILLTSGRQRDLVEKAREFWIFAFLMKPVTEGGLLSAVDSALLSFQREQELQKEVDKLKDTLETRKLVEKAKGILMQNIGFSEAEAFQRIQRQSMEKGKPMKQIAEAIILTYDLKK